MPNRRIDQKFPPGGEQALLRRLRSRAAAGVAASGVSLGIGDDCALLSARVGEELAVTTDLSIAGRHFRLDWHPPEAVGHRALARGLSDLAAMGARPLAAFLSLGLPRELTGSEPGPTSRRGSVAWMSRFLDGLLALARAHKTQLAGGDLAEAPVPVADIVLIGAVPRGRALLRSGAKVGDLIYVTGTLGGAATGLKRLEELADGNRRLTDRLLKHNSLNTRLRIALAQHLYPNPRVAQGLWLQRRGLATAAIDLSDGLSTDLAHLCEESGVAAEVEEGLLPVHAGATLDQALSGGEDYELLFTARAGARMPKSIAGVPVKRIGRVVKQRRGRPAITLLTADASRPLEPRGWEHFS